MVIWADSTNESFWVGIVGYFQGDFTRTYLKKNSMNQMFSLGTWNLIVNCRTTQVLNGDCAIFEIFFLQRLLGVQGHNYDLKPDRGSNLKL